MSYNIPFTTYILYIMMTNYCLYNRGELSNNAYAIYVLPCSNINLLQLYIEWPKIREYTTFSQWGGILSYPHYHKLKRVIRNKLTYLTF